MKITHAFIVQRTAADLRAVAKILEDTAKECELGGDLQVAEAAIIEGLPGWRETLALRLAYLTDNKGEEMDFGLAKELGGQHEQAT